MRKIIIFSAGIPAISLALIACTPAQKCGVPDPVAPIAYTKGGGSPIYADREPILEPLRACPVPPATEGGYRASVADPDTPATPDTPTETEDPGVGKVRGDNSDANGKGGNRHDRQDFDTDPQEIAEGKKS